MARNISFEKVDDTTIRVTEENTKVDVREFSLNEIEERKAELQKAIDATTETHNAKMQGLNEQLSKIDDLITAAKDQGVSRRPSS